MQYETRMSCGLVKGHAYSVTAVEEVCTSPFPALHCRTRAEKPSPDRRWHALLRISMSPVQVLAFWGTGSSTTRAEVATASHLLVLQPSHTHPRQVRLGNGGAGMSSLTGRTFLLTVLSVYSCCILFQLDNI